MGMANFTGIIGKGRSNASRQLGSDRSYMGPRNSVATAMDEWHRARPDLDLGPVGLFAALAHVYWLTAPEIERLMAAHGVTLTTLRRAGLPYTLAPKQLSQSLLLSGAGITNRLDKLEALKLIRRLPEPPDRRGLKIRLTQAGLRLVDRLLPQLIRLESSLAAGMIPLTTMLSFHLTRVFSVKTVARYSAPSAINLTRRVSASL
jgi:DNA-binding MarR family transcriptional regulator